MRICEGFAKMFFMLKFFRDYLKQKEQRQEFFSLLIEAKANLEAYYVMFQLNRLRHFTLDIWENVNALPEYSQEALSEYSRRLSQYNSVLKDYKDFEFWYNEDLDRKNQDNGRILHQKKELVQEHFKGLEAVIKAAVVSVEQEGIRRKILKPAASAV